MDNALGVLEFGSVARGIVATDEILKTAEVTLLGAQTVCPGKYLVMVTGGISAVTAACDRAKRLSDGLIDTFVSGRLPSAVLEALKGVGEPGGLESLGVVEAFSIPAAVKAAETVVKAAGARLLEIRTSRGMGGKSFVLLTGPVGVVGAALEAVRSGVEEALLLDTVLIPRPDPSVWNSIA